MNRITIRVKPNARKNKVEEIDAQSFIVSVTASPIDGKANEKIIEVLAEYFCKPKNGDTSNFRNNYFSLSYYCNFGG